MNDSFGAQGGIRTRDALDCSSVARVTAVHTFGRLPQAVDRAILPLRIPRFMEQGASPAISWARLRGKACKLKLSPKSNAIRALLPDNR